MKLVPDDKLEGLSAEELAALGATYMLGVAVGQLAHMGADELEIHEAFERAIEHNFGGKIGEMS